MGSAETDPRNPNTTSPEFIQQQQDSFSSPNPYDDVIPLEPNTESHAPEPSRDSFFALSWPASIYLIIAIVLLVVSLVHSPRPFYSSLFVLLAFVPALPVASFIVQKFRDPAVRNSFLTTQFLLGAVPLIFIVGLVELFLSAAFAFLVFRSEISAAREALANLQTINATPAETDKALQQLLTIIPLWKVILFFLLVAFITAGFVEETGKWLVARRYRKLLIPEDARAVPIGVRGVLACACAGALGFALTENVAYVLGIAKTTQSGVSFALIGIALLRGVLAFPVHVGTQFYVGLSAAESHVLRDRVSVSLALFLAVLFHGTFDAVAFVCMVLIGLKKLPEWVGLFVPVFDLMLIGFLLLLCRGRYKGLLERERVLIASDPV